MRKLKPKSWKTLEIFKDTIIIAINHRNGTNSSSEYSFFHQIITLSGNSSSSSSNFHDECCRKETKWRNLCIPAIVTILKSPTVETFTNLLIHKKLYYYIINLSNTWNCNYQWTCNYPKTFDCSITCTSFNKYFATIETKTKCSSSAFFKNFRCSAIKIAELYYCHDSKLFPTCPETNSKTQGFKYEIERYKLKKYAIYSNCNPSNNGNATKPPTYIPIHSLQQSS